MGSRSQAPSQATQASNASSQTHSLQRSANPTTTQDAEQTVESLEEQPHPLQPSKFNQNFSQVPVSTSSFPFVQPKLRIGVVGDRYEQEADRIADQVMQMPDPTVLSGSTRSKQITPFSIQRFQPGSLQKLQRKIEPSAANEEEEVVQAKVLPSSLLNTSPEKWIQRKAEAELETTQESEEEEEEPVQAKFLSTLTLQPLPIIGDEQLQRQVDTASDVEEEDEEEAVQAKGVSPHRPSIQASFTKRLKASQGGGYPLADSTRKFMESRFKHDFSQVRVHADGQAHQLARELNAQAFTFKQDIYFGAGYYQPHTSAGKRLLAHELTHTLQQQPTSALPSLQFDYPTSSVTVSEAVSTTQPLVSLRRTEGQPSGTSVSPEASVTSIPKPVEEAEADTNLSPKAQQSPEGNVPAPGKSEDDTQAKEAEVQTEKADADEAETPVPSEPQKAPTSPKEDPAFQATLKQINQTKRTQQQHAPPDTKLGEVKAAAVLPENEQKENNDRKQHLEAIAKTAETVDKDKKAFKPETFKQLLQQNLNVIEKHLPQDEAGARQFKHDKPLGAVKENIGKQVTSENEKVAAPITGQVKQAPPNSGLPTKAATALKEAPIGSKPQPIDPQAAAPKPKHDSEISMEEESQKLDDKLSENKMTEDQLAESGEDKFKEALNTKRQAQQEAKAAPQHYRQEEEKVLAKAENKAQGAGKEQFGAMVGDRQGTFDTIYSKQVATEKADTGKQQEFFKALESIYNGTKEKVGNILTTLSENVNNTFSEESERAKKTFEDTVEEKLDDIHGLGIVEFFAGEDTEAIEQVFKEEKGKFLAAMDKTLDKIANLIAQELNSAIAEIEKGRAESEKKFNELDKDQQEKARDAMELFRGQYDDLENSVDEKQNELAQTLAESYKENVDSLRETFDKINEEVKKSWIDRAIDFIEEVASAIAKLADLLQSVLQRVAALIGDILSHPIRFLENLAAGVKAGFDKFIAGIQGYLIGGFFDWLRGSMGGAGITIPDKLDAAGIFSLVMQVLGLSYDTFRTLAVKILGKEEIELLEKGAGAAEKGLEIFQLIRGKGLVALWEHLKGMIASSFDGIINQVKETVLFETVKKALAFIGSLFTPAGAFIKAVQLLYKGLRFLVDNIDRITELVNAFMDSIELAIRGNSGGIASRIVKALQSFIVLAIDFLAKLLGLGDLSQKVRKILQAIRKPIERAIEWLLKKVKPIVKRIFKKVKGLIKKGKAFAKKVKKKVRTLAKKTKKSIKKLFGKDKKDQKSKKNITGEVLDFQVQEPFIMSGMDHTLTMKVNQEKFEFIIASDPDKFVPALKAAITEVKKSKRPTKEADLKKLNEILKEVLEIPSDIAKNESEIVKGAKGGFAGARKAISQYAKERIARIANTLESFAATAGIKSLDDFYATPPTERYIPGYPDQTTVGKFIRGKLYDSLGWDKVRQGVLDEEEKPLIKRVKDAQLNKDLILWKQLKVEGLVEENASIDAHSYNPEKVDYEVDHIEPVSTRWNDKGRDDNDDTRYKQMSERINLRLVTKEYNRAKGGVSYIPHVGPNFTSKLAEGGIKGSLKIDEKPFLDASGKPLKEK